MLVRQDKHQFNIENNAIWLLNSS